LIALSYLLYPNKEQEAIMAPLYTGLSATEKAKRDENPHTTEFMQLIGKIYRTENPELEGCVKFYNNATWKIIDFERAKNIVGKILASRNELPLDSTLFKDWAIVKDSAKTSEYTQ